MVVVADAGMLSNENLHELEQAHLLFIVGSRVTKAPNALASHFRWHGGAFSNGQLIDTITPRTGTPLRTTPRSARSQFAVASSGKRGRRRSSLQREMWTVMTELSEALLRIEIGSERLGRGAVLRALRPGLEREAAVRLLKAASLPADAQVESLYGWRDGTQNAEVTLDDIHLFPGFYLLSLEDALANYCVFVADPRWRPGWLPVWSNGGGDFYLVDLGEQPSGLIRHFRVEEAEHPVEFRSLSDMVTTVAAAFDRDVFFVHPDGYLE